MGKKYLDTKEASLESSILGVWAEAAKKVDETNKNDKSDDGEGLDAVQPKAVKKKFKDRKDKDIDNDGDTDDSDKFLHKKRKAISKAMKDEGNAFGKALKAAKEKGDKTFVVAGKTYEVYEESDLDEGKVIFDDHDDEDEDFIALTKKLGLKFKTKNDETTVSGSDANIAKMLKTMKMKKDTDGHAILEKVKESYEIGTNKYRDHTLEVTPGQTDPEWAQARDFKVASMREALAKVWGLDEKKEEYDEEDEELKPVKGSKTMTGGKVAKVDTKPKMENVENLVEGKMGELHGYIEAGKSAEWIAKKMGVDVKTIKSLMSSYESHDGDDMKDNSEYMEMLAAACGGGAMAAAQA